MTTELPVAAQQLPTTELVDPQRRPTVAWYRWFKFVDVSVRRIAKDGFSYANPTATAKDTAVNGVAVTAMRSDAAPAIQKASSSQFGIVKVDGTTITATGGVISASGGGGGTGTEIDLYSPPTAASFSTIINSGSASPAPACSDVSGLGMVFDHGASQSGDNIRAALKNVAGATWTVTAMLRMTIGLNSFRGAGLVVTDGTKYITWGIQMSGTVVNLTVAKMTNGTTFSANARQIAAGFVPRYFQVILDGTNITFLHSDDGRNFVQFFQEAKATFLAAPTQYGLGGNARSAATPPATGEHDYTTVPYWLDA